EASGLAAEQGPIEPAAPAWEAGDADLPAAADRPSAPIDAAVPARPASVQIGDSVISAALHALYTDEAGRHLATLGQALAGARAVPAPATVRAAHTLAGISGTAGLPPLHQLGRALEQALERLQALGRAPDAD